MILEKGETLLFSRRLLDLEVKGNPFIPAYLFK